MKKGLGLMVERKEEKMRKGLGLAERRKEEEKMKREMSWIAEKALGLIGGKNKEVEKMRKGLSIIVGIAILLFAYSASAAVVTDGLVSWWKLDETSGTSAYDSQGDNTGTVSGATWTTETAGVNSSGALSFDGTSNYVDCGTDASLTLTNALTVEAWVNLDQVKAYQTIVSKWYDGGNIAWDFRMNVGGNKLEFRLHDGTAERSIVGSTVLGTDTWYHVAGTWDGFTAMVYVGTSQEGSSNITGTLGPVAETLIGNIQHPSANEYFSGKIDEARIYNRALTSGEIQQNYDAIPEPTTLLLLGGGLLILSLKRFRK